MTKRNTEKIKKAAKLKSIQKREKVLKILDKMKNNNSEITFASVAKKAEVSRNYLYKNNELRILIESLRETAIIKKIQNKDSKDVIIDIQRNKIKELNKKIKELETYLPLKEKYHKLLIDNNELKKQLKKAYKY